MDMMDCSKESWMATRLVLEKVGTCTNKFLVISSNELKIKTYDADDPNI